MMKRSTPRANCIKTQSYNVGRKMLAKLSNHSSSTTQNRKPRVKRSEPAGLIEELRNSSGSDEISVRSQESGISSLSSSSSSRGSSFRHHRTSGSSLRKNDIGWQQQEDQDQETMNHSYGTAPRQGKLVFDGVYA